MWYVIILGLIVTVLWVWQQQRVFESFKIKKKKKKRRNRSTEVDEEAIARTLVPKVINPSEQFFRIAYPTKDVRPYYQRKPTVLRGTNTSYGRNVRRAWFDNHESMLLQYMSCMSIPRDSYEAQQMTNAPFLNFRLSGSNTQTVVEQALGIIKAIASRETKKVVARSELLDVPRAPSLGKRRKVPFVPLSPAPGNQNTSVLVNQIPLYPDVDALPQTVTPNPANKDASAMPEDPYNNFESGLVSSGIGDKYDFVQDYRQRFRDLLRLLNLLEQEELLMQQYPPPNTKHVSLANDKVMRENQDIEPPMYTSSESDSMFKTWDAKVKKSENTVVKESEVVRSTPGYVQGPIYLFLANDPKSLTVEGYLYFPSITKDGRPAPNLHFIGRTHRWIHRLMFARMYYENGDNVATCKLGCSGLPSFRDGATDYIVRCGCNSTKAKHCKPKGTTRNPKGFDPPRNTSFVAYKMNPNHPHISNFMDPQFPKELQLNILPANTHMYNGCGHQLISQNMQFYLRLNRHQLILYENVQQEDLVKACAQGISKEGNPLLSVSFPEVAVYMSVSEGSLRVATTKPMYRNKRELINEEEQEDTWSYTVSSNADEPLSLVLMDDGTMRVYNSEDVDVTTERFKNVYTTSSAMPNEGQEIPIDENAMLAEMKRFQKKYKNQGELGWRIEHLRMWLKARNLYKSTVNYIDPDSIGLQKALGNTLRDGTPYDPSEDYAQRITSLIAFIEQKGLWKEIQDHQRVFDIVETDPETQESTENEVGMFDYKKRLADLIAFLQQRGLWKNY